MPDRQTWRSIISCLLIVFTPVIFKFRLNIFDADFNPFNLIPVLTLYKSRKKPLDWQEYFQLDEIEREKRAIFKSVNH